MIKPDSALYRWDREIIARLLHVEQPSNDDFTNASRLYCRYRDTTNLDLVTDILRAASHWGLSIQDVNARSKAIWKSGWRPGGIDNVVSIGSGADSE